MLVYAAVCCANASRRQQVETIHGITTAQAQQHPPATACVVIKPVALSSYEENALATASSAALSLPCCCAVCCLAPLLLPLPPAYDLHDAAVLGLLLLLLRLPGLLTL
jgi:hypothetical protein